MHQTTRRLVLAAASFAALTLIAPRPAVAAVEKVVCKDGTADEGGRGACSGHGGIDKVATAAAEKAAAAKAKKEKAEKAKAEKAEKAKESKEKAPEAKGEAAKGPPTAKCKDGTLSYAEHHTGACSNHGGVETWLDKK